MRTGAFFLAVCFATSLCAQIPGVGSVVNPAGGAGTPGVTRTTGSVVNPAGGVVRPAIPGLGGVSSRRGGTALVYPAYIGGYYYMPYISPSYAAGSAYDPNALQAPAQTNVTVVTPPAQLVTPVVINYNYGTAPPPPGPAAATAQAPEAPAPDEASAPEPAHYLIAMKDHTIYVATAYWVDGNTLHYFTAGNVHNQAALSQVDRDFTLRLNKEAGVDVDIPAPAK